MKTDHRLPLQDYRYAVLPDWQPAPRLPRLVRALVLLLASGIGWGLVLLLAVAVAAIVRGGI